MKINYIYPIGTKLKDQYGKIYQVVKYNEDYRWSCGYANDAEGLGRIPLLLLNHKKYRGYTKFLLPLVRVFKTNCFTVICEAPDIEQIIGNLEWS